MIEGLYWESQHIPFKLIFADKIDKDYHNNIKRAVLYYNKDDVFDDISRFQHLVATKQVKIDMRNGLVDWKKAATEYFKNNEK